MRCWGDNSYGQSEIPKDVEESPILAVSTGTFHTCAILSDSSRRLRCWVYNEFGASSIPTEMYLADI